MFLLDTTTTMYTVGDVVALSKHLVFFHLFSWHFFDILLLFIHFCILYFKYLRVNYKS
jgi:hypothetical protein